MSNQAKITCSNVWKLFGSDEKRIINPHTAGGGTVGDTAAEELYNIIYNC